MNPAEARASLSFHQDAGTARLNVAHDDGLYRHLRFRRPDTSLYWFDLVTWPGCLAFAGDMGAFTFRRTDDMLGFFLTGPGINPGYWAEKVLGDDDVRAFDPDLFAQHVTEAFRDHADQHGWVLAPVAELWARIEDDVLACDQDEQAAYAAAVEFDFPAPEWDDDELAPPSFAFTEAWEWRLRGYTHRFLWACHAIRWGAEQYQAARQGASA